MVRVRSSAACAAAGCEVARLTRRGHRPSARVWWRLHATVPAVAEEFAGWVLASAGARGVEVGPGALPDKGVAAGDPPAEDSVTLVAYFSEPRAARRALTWLARHLKAGPQLGARPQSEQGARLALRLSKQAVRPERWLAAWRMTLRPVRVGDLVVRPTGAARPRSARAGKGSIWVRPAMAFGTGHHPTTVQALWALQHAVLRVGAGGRVVDLGTGSGILAIAAARLGAREVLGVDVDPVALEEAARNVRANGVDKTVRLALGSCSQVLARWGAGAADVVVANLSAADLTDLAGALAAMVRPGGVVIGAGMTADQVEIVCRAWEAAGLSVDLWGRWAGWAWIEATRPEGQPSAP